MDNWEVIQDEEIKSEKSFNDKYNILIEEVCKLDKFELLAMFAAWHYFSMIMEDYSTDIRPALVEYIAGICITSENTGKVKVKKSQFDFIFQLCKQLADEQLIINMFSSINENDDDEIVKMKLFSGEMKNSYSFTRGYSWYRKIEEDNIRSIFDGFEEKIVTLIGFDPNEAYIVMDAYAYLIFDRMRGTVLPKLSTQSDIKRGYEIFSLIGENYYEMMSVSRDELYEKCNELSREHFDALIQFFSCEITNSVLDEKVKYYTDDNYFSTHPIIDDGEKLLIINHQLLLWNLRECIEEKIKQNSKLWNEYDKKHKAKFLEKKSAELIEKILPQCKIYNSLYYKPEGEESACELDLLAIYDNIVILVESKSGTYSRPAKRGGLKRLENVVDKNIEYAFKQADRTRTFIYQNAKAEFYFDSTLKKEAVTLKADKVADVFIINTTLDHYAELGVDLYKLRDFGIYKGKEFPWTVCIADLEIITDFMDFPNQFLYYMYLRRTINNTFSEKNGAMLIYELDLLAMYKTENTDKFLTYNIGDDSADSSMFENGIKPTARDYSNYFRIFYDKYYEKKEKPEIEKKLYNTRFLQMCRQLEEYDAKGFSFFLLRFLDLDLDDQNWLFKAIDKSCERTRNDKKMHTITIKRMPQHFFADPFGLVIYSAYEKDRKEVETHAYVSGRIQQGLTGIRHWITLCVFLDDDRHFINQFYFHSGTEELTEEMRRITSHIPVTAPIKVYPNDLCPCGSGLKYKKCCMKK